MTTAFGLDLSGFSTGGSAMARADRTGERIVVTIYTGHCFSEKVEGCDELPDILEREQQIVMACLNRGPLVVDIPIDLQGLPNPLSCAFAWQLVQRPVDYVFAARPPLADRLGAPVARFLAVSGPLRRAKKALLGRNLFETYPAAALGLLQLQRKKYKGRALFGRKGTWKPAPAENKDKPNAEDHGKSKILAATLNALRWTANPGDVLTHDGFDAGLCAITGAADKMSRLQDPQLSVFIRQQFAKKLPECVISRRLAAPVGYILLRKQPLGVEVRLKSVEGEEELLDEIRSSDTEHRVLDSAFLNGLPPSTTRRGGGVIAPKPPSPAR